MGSRSARPDMDHRLTRLEQLTDRHDHGDFTDAEFAAAKQQLVSAD